MFKSSELINLIKRRASRVLMIRYYFDTSIWLDWFEDRNEPGFPKTDLAYKLLSRIVMNNEIIIISGMVLFELGAVGYSSEEIDRLFKPLKQILVFVEASDQEIRKAKDLAAKRQVPRGDALHALIARDQKAILVTFDKDFQELLDIIKPKTPRELV